MVFSVVLGLFRDLSYVKLSFTSVMDSDFTLRAHKHAKATLAHKKPARNQISESVSDSLTALRRLRQ